MLHTTARATEGSLDSDLLPPLVRALLRPEAYAHRADDLCLRETHASWVILAGAYAYKIKKPVDLGFLNFSTIERRAADCVDEVRLNRRLCPDVYLGVVEVVMRDGTYFLGGPGRSVEPAVWMRRLPESGMLPHLLARGQVDTGLVQRIAGHLADFHATAATGPGVDEYGSLATVRANWDESFAQMAPFLGRTISGETNAAIATYVQRFLSKQAALLERRVADGRIRDGHGDLHAASICLEGDRLQLFDCLQFAPRFRCADVAAEVAFLVMDLEHYGRADLSTAFAHEYVRASGDEELFRLLDFYACYRAYVRGKVRSLRLAQTSPRSADGGGSSSRRREAISIWHWHTAGRVSRSSPCRRPWKNVGEPPCSEPSSSPWTAQIWPSAPCRMRLRSPARRTGT